MNPYKPNATYSRNRFLLESPGYPNLTSSITSRSCEVALGLTLIVGVKIIVFSYEGEHDNPPFCLHWNNLTVCANKSASSSVEFTLETTTNVSFVTSNDNFYGRFLILMYGMYRFFCDFGDIYNHIISPSRFGLQRNEGSLIVIHYKCKTTYGKFSSTSHKPSK